MLINVRVVRPGSLFKLAYRPQDLGVRGRMEHRRSLLSQLLVKTGLREGLVGLRTREVVASVRETLLLADERPGTVPPEIISLLNVDL